MRGTRIQHSQTIAPSLLSLTAVHPSVFVCVVRSTRITVTSSVVIFIL